MNESIVKSPSQILPIVFLLLPYSTLAQDSLSAVAFLQMELARIDVEAENELFNRTFQAPWIQKVEVRTETEDFQLNQQQYQLRLSPSTPKIRKAEQQLQQLYQKDIAERLAEEKFKLVINTYEKVLRAYELYQLLETENNLLRLAQKEAQIVERLIIANQLEPRDWIQTQKQLLDTEQKRDQHKMEYDFITNGIVLLWDNFMPISRLVEEVQKVTPSNFVARDSQIDLDILQGEISLEKAESKKRLDFLQFEYNSNPQDVFRERAAVSAAFLLPFKGNRKLKMEELAIEQMGLEAETKLQNKWQIQQIIELKNEILLLYEHLLLSEQKVKAFEEKTTLLVQRIQQSEEARPLLLLSMEKQSLENDLDRLNLEAKIRERYLKLMEESDGLLGFGE